MTIAEQITRAKTDLDNVYEAGKQAASGGFDWEKYFAQVKQYGNGSYLFAGKGWNENTFNPPYGEKGINFIQNAQGLFYYSGYIPKDRFKVFDWSTMTTAPQFGGSSIAELPEMELTGANTIGSVFSNSSVRSVDKLILRSDGSQSFVTNTFGTSTLTHIIIEGVIGKTVTLSSCPLDKDSITSFVNALSLDVTGQTTTFKLSAINKAFETSKGANDGSASAEWAALKATKPNWGINAE